MEDLLVRFVTKAKIVYLIVLHKIFTGLDLDKEKTILKLKILEVEQVPKNPGFRSLQNGVKKWVDINPHKNFLQYSKICMKRGRVRISFNQFLHGIPNSEHVIKK